MTSTNIANALYAFAFNMCEAERWREASDVFRAMLLLVPDDERSWLGLGRCHREIGQDDVALELYSLCVVAQPKAVRARIELAKLLRAKRDDGDADRMLDTAEEIVDAMVDADDGLVQLIQRARTEGIGQS